jgi:phosphoglycolate phosphatase
MKKAVFFDWDGTLVDSLPFLHLAHNHAREALGYPLWSMEEYKGYMLFSARELYPRLYGDHAEEAWNTLYGFISENHLKHITLIDGALELIETLQCHGFPMGVVSNKRNDVLRKEIEHLGWQKYFGSYFGAGVAAKDKPAGDPLFYALEHHPEEISINDVIYVGDTESDLGCAQEAGCPCAFILHPPQRYDLVEKYNPAIIAHNLVELKEKLIKYLGF